jgi:hypothetical protein
VVHYVELRSVAPNVRVSGMRHGRPHSPRHSHLMALPLPAVLASSQSAL